MFVYNRKDLYNSFIWFTTVTERSLFQKDFVLPLLLYISFLWINKSKKESITFSTVLKREICKSTTRVCLFIVYLYVTAFHNRYVDRNAYSRIFHCCHTCHMPFAQVHMNADQRFSFNLLLFTFTALYYNFAKTVSSLFL